MPRCCSSAPRKKLPPPTTTATWTCIWFTMAICLASPATTSGSTPTLPPPKTSPESFSITRLYGPFTVGFLSLLWSCPCNAPTLAARRWRRQAARLLRGGRLKSYEAQDLDACLIKLLAEGSLAIDDRRLVEQRDVFE